MMRITSLFWLILAGLLTFFGCKKPERPNILYIMSDDHAAHAISAYGGIYDDYFQTPNIDRIATEGMRFNNVFCTNSICGPSRASILTGKYSHQNGYYKNVDGGLFDEEQWTFPKAFQQNGYETALFGKWHLGSEPRGFDYFKYHVFPNQQGRYNNPIYNKNGENVEEHGYATNLTTNSALEWLQARREETQPFLMVLQFKAPHRPWMPDEKYLNLFDSVDLPFQSTFDDDYATRRLTAGDTDMTMDFFTPGDMKLSVPDSLKGKQARAWKNMGVKRGKGEGWLPSDTMDLEESRRWKYQRFIKDYLACVKSVDDNIGRVMNYLDESGLAENTLVVYTSDQGFYLGDHGWFDKRFIYEQSLRMPFLVKYDHIIQKGTQNNDIITNIDFAPTLLDLAGLKIPGEIQGRSFKANLSGNTPEDWPQSMYYHYYEYPFYHHVQPHYGIRSDRYKLIHFYYDRDIWEFYDLREDPNELQNLIDHQGYFGIIDSMKKEFNRFKHQFMKHTTRR